MQALTWNDELWVLTKGLLCELRLASKECWYGAPGRSTLLHPSPQGELGQPLG